MEVEEDLEGVEEDLEGVGEEGGVEVQEEAEAEAEEEAEEEDGGGWKWMQYRTPMNVCFSCFVLKSRTDRQCACGPGYQRGWQAMAQSVLDSRAAKRRRPEQQASANTTASEPSHADRQCRILSYRHGSSQTLGALPQKELSVAVPRVLHGMGRRDRWVIVQLRSSDEEGQWVGWCSHPECSMEDLTRLASGQAHHTCPHVKAASRAADTAGPGDVATITVDLRGCFAHVASGSSSWACGGLRVCEPCGFSKLDVEAEACHECSNPSNPPDTSPLDQSHVAPRRTRSTWLAKQWFLPDGYRVQSGPPSEVQLAAGAAEGAALVGRRLLWNWLPPVRTRGPGNSPCSHLAMALAMAVAIGQSSVTLPLHALVHSMAGVLEPWTHSAITRMI